MIRHIVQIGNPALRVIANVVEESQIASKEIQSLIDDLIETMRACKWRRLSVNSNCSSLSNMRYRSQ